MKKRLAVGIIVLTMVVGVFAVNVYAANTNELPSERAYGHMMGRSNREIDLNNQERREFRNDRQEKNINRAIENNVIIEDEANEPRSHFNNRDKFNEENSNRGQHCQGRKRGKKHGHGMIHRRNK